MTARRKYEAGESMNEQISKVNARLDQIEHLLHMDKVRQTKIVKRLEEIERQHDELLKRITAVPVASEPPVDPNQGAAHDAPKRAKKR
jgi:TolA-binding protein